MAGKKARRDKRSPFRPSPDFRDKKPTYAVGDILPAILAQYGIGRTRPEDDLAEHWEMLAGKLATQTCVLGLRRGILEIGVTNAIFIQELTFQKQEILKKLQKIYTDGNIRDIRFRVEKKRLDEDEK
ncbi:MAG: DUF721 domain-containing protein [Planctomycetia bacterium]|nr:DUF721 domain-containing protein [Planctomycetia bacterium]